MNMYASFCMPAVTLYYCAFQGTVSKIKNVCFIFVFFLCAYYLCENYYKPITVKYYIANCVRWGPKLILLDYEQTGLTNGLSE